MHTYRKSRNEPLWTVGYYRPGDSRNDTAWVPLSDHSSELEAMQRVNFLNGGARRTDYPDQG